MKKRYIYSLLFGLPGFFVSLVVAAVIFGFVMGFLWIFVFGDNEWPSSTFIILSVLLVLVFLIVWGLTIAAGFFIGKRLENDPVLNRKHIWISGGITTVFVLFIVFRLLSATESLGPKSDLERCTDYCSNKGYALSETVPEDSGKRSCICLNDLGQEGIQIPLESIDAEISE
ncbi:MAG TPA: hypothetical protein VJB60_03615 [Candidatus Peribacterales bacterium]|nr:hypothetical protein [Candidatus Peribacterales bacterium]